MATLQWKERLAAEEIHRGSQTGRHTLAALMPVLEAWINRRHGVLDFRLTQVLSGHGYFGRYLWRIGREPHPGCHQCGHPDDNTQHALEACPRWEYPRQSLVAVLGADLSLPVVVSRMVEDERCWRAMADYADLVMTLRETEERERECDPNSVALRRKRRGGRRG